MKSVKPNFRLQFFGGIPFITVKKSGNTEESLLRGLLDVRENTVGIEMYHYYFPNFPKPISHKDYCCSIVLTHLCTQFRAGEFTMYLKAGDEIWMG